MIIMKNNITPRLPDEYQEVEYIQSTGTQYIDTGIMPSSSTNITMDYEYISGQSGRYIPLACERITVGANMFGIWINDRTKEVAINYGTIDTAAISGTNGAGRHTYSNDGNKWYLDGSLIKTISTSSFSSTGTFFIFALNGGTEIQTRDCTAKLYSFTAYQNSNLIRNLVPCYRKSDNAIGLYDLVNNVFYTNAGTGVFLMGAEVNKEYFNLKPMVSNKKLLKRYVGENLIYGESEPSYEQKVNYTMLYDNGDECTALTGGWKVSSRYNNAVATKYTDHIYLHASTASTVTNNLIDLTQYVKFGGVLKNIVSTTGQARFAIGKSNSATDGTSLGWNGIAGNKVYNLTKSYSHFVGLYNLSKSESYYLATMVSDAKNNAYGSVYNMFLLKQDDWQTLCTKAEFNSSNHTDEATLCADSTAIAEILSNESAVKYMIYNCTGSFMGEFIANDDCLTALNNSPYKTLIQANEHWNKFLNMVA